ncbi:Flavin reductase [Candidatus Desulfarcum epimagneticum]|uniref:Flavin reductase n=1 Tax=uncultured Desulfobacteraceae bacterium TaxID=218296 RepID=A0A484HM80_9BACT|nr:Flavin reductase [uncultured Desulfobacteraceae bacterium]
MFALGLQGSPRKKGNTQYLLSKFMDGLSAAGAETRVIEPARENIRPCRGCGYCEKKGYCVIADDDMAGHVYADFRRADIVVSATPIFFYSATAQLKALIDRSQALWSRKYALKRNEPGKNSRKGFMLALGATKGANLFEGLTLTHRYFFDALSAGFHGSLTYRRIEKAGDIQKYGDLEKEVREAAASLMAPFSKRKTVLFACRENACRSQMAGAFARLHAGDKLDVMTGGSEPAEEVNPMMVEAMEEKGVDMAFLAPSSFEDAISKNAPDLIFTMGCAEQCPAVPGATVTDWDIPDPAGKDLALMRKTRDEIERRVLDLAQKI